MKKLIISLIALVLVVNMNAWDWDRNKVDQGRYDGVTTYARGSVVASYNENTNEYTALKNISTEEFPNSFETLSDPQSIYLELEQAYMNDQILNNPSSEYKEE